MRSRRRLALLAATLTLVVAALSGVLRARPLGAQRYMHFDPNVPYDGRFTFVRAKYIPRWRSGWEFDYPAMERNFMKLTDELTTLRPHTGESNIHTFDDPELLKFPIAYLSEPGGWYLSPEEADGLRNYLAKGGFLWVDDFMRDEWVQFERQIRLVLPDARFVRLDASHPVYNTFFHVDSLAMRHPQETQLRGEFYGIYEDNDPSKRLEVVIDYNTDIGDFMEWSGQGWFPVNVTNDAYKIAIDYIIYGMTH